MLESNRRSGKRQTKRITILNDVSSLRVLSQCVLCSQHGCFALRERPALRLGMIWRIIHQRRLSSLSKLICTPRRKLASRFKLLFLSFMFSSVFIKSHSNCQCNGRIRLCFISDRSIGVRSKQSWSCFENHTNIPWERSIDAIHFSSF